MVLARMLWPTWICNIDVVILFLILMSEIILYKKRTDQKLEKISLSKEGKILLRQLLVSTIELLTLSHYLGVNFSNEKQ